MKQDSLVTIAIASYNNGTYIERCLDSVVNQSYDNLEIIVVDDGSKDDTLFRLEKYKKDSRVKVISKENGGLSSVRRLALDLATGSYICFIDADDYLLDNYVYDLYTKIRKTDADVCLISVRFEDDFGLELYNEDFTEDNMDSAITIKRKLFATNFLESRSQYKLSDSWNKLYRVEFLRRVSVNFELPAGYNGSDMVFNHLVFLYEPKVTSVSNVGYVHLVHNNSAVHRKNKKLIEGFIFAFNRILKEVNKESIFELFKKPLSVLFVELMRRGIQDEFTEHTSNKIIRQHIKRSKDYAYLNNLGLDLSIMPSISLKLFLSLYVYYPFLLPLYFKLRSINKTRKNK